MVTKHGCFATSTFWMPPAPPIHPLRNTLRKSLRMAEQKELAGGVNPEMRRISLPTGIARCIGFLVLMFVAVGCAASATPDNSIHPPVPAATNSELASAKAAPLFTLPSALGSQISLDSYAGKNNVVLVFYRGFW